jgi:uncharacterized protein (TIGR00297 family)
MSIDAARIATGLVLSIAIGGLAYWRQSLSVSGWLGAVITGTLTFGFGGWPWGLTLITFFISSSLLSRYKEAVKERRAAEKFSKGGRRDLAQALANGGVAAFLALLYELLGEPSLLLALFLGVMATVTADTWATELGVLSNHPPRLITSGRQVEPGTSGGVTVTGTVAAAAGGLLIGSAMLIFSMMIEFPPGMAAVPWWMLPAGMLGGLAGAMFDSLLGATVQAIYRYPDGRETERTLARDGTPNTFVRGWRWMNNDVVNLLSSLTGGLGAALMFFLFAG